MIRLSSLMTRFFLIACMTLPFTACTEKAPPPKVEKGPLSVPTTEEAGAWRDYVSDVVTRNMGGIENQPYVYLLPAGNSEDFEGSYERLAEKAKSDVSRGIIRGNLLAYASPESAKMADLVVDAFKDVPADTMKGVKVLFIGKNEDNDRVKAAVAPAGVDYTFIPTN